MSRSDTNNLQNPCTRWMKWEGKDTKGHFSWYDKETEETHVIEKPFTFLVLEQLNTVTGYDRDLKVGFYANEVKNISTDILTVRSKKGIEDSGLWSEIKGNKNFDFTKSVYVAFFDDNKKLKIGNIKFKGSGLSGLTDDAIKENLEEAKVNAKVLAKQKNVDVKTIPLDSYTPAFLKSIGWINFSNSRKDLYEIAVSWVDVIPDRNGDTDFLRPAFAAKDVSDATNQAAIELDKELKVYLNEYFKNTLKTAENTNEPEEDIRTQRDREINNFDNNVPEFTGGDEPAFDEQKPKTGWAHEPPPFGPDDDIPF